MPSDLYRFVDKPRAAADAQGQRRSRSPMTLDNGYVAIDAHVEGRRRRSTSTCRCRSAASSRNDQVAADRDRVALQRGPIVYAAEWPDNPNGKVRNIVLPDANALTAEFRPDLLNGVAGHQGPRRRPVARRARQRCRRAEQPFMAIPYATWANRGRGQMAVWLARTDAAARPTPYPTVATTTHADATRRARQEHRATSSTARIRARRTTRRRTSTGGRARLHAPAPRRAAAQAPAPAPCSKGEWIEMAFAKPATVSEPQVYWFDDTGRGGVRVPAVVAAALQGRRRLEAGREPRGEYGVAQDAYNTVRFKPVTTTALRLELVMQPASRPGAGMEGQVKFNLRSAQSAR